jgi:hypothetical protein
MDRTHPVGTATWISLTTIGLAGGLVAGLLIGMPLGQIVNAMVVTAAVTCVVGGVLGSFQAVGLRRTLRKPLWWVVATIVGVGVGLATGVVLVEQTGILITGKRPSLARLDAGMRALSFVAVGFVAGTLLGVAQWLVLRAQARQVKHWVLASGFALAFAFSSSSLLVDLSGLRIASAAGAITFLLASGAAFGALTSWPLYAQRPDSHRQVNDGG